MNRNECRWKCVVQCLLAALDDDARKLWEGNKIKFNQSAFILFLFSAMFQDT